MPTPFADTRGNVTVLPASTTLVGSSVTQYTSVYIAHRLNKRLRSSLPTITSRCGGEKPARARVMPGMVKSSTLPQISDTTV